MSLEREEQQETGCAATYRRRHSKKAQGNGDGKFDGVHGLTCGSSSQSSQKVDVSHISEPCVSVRKRVSRVVYGSSKQRYKVANAAHHAHSSANLNSSQADSSALNADSQEPCSPDPGNPGCEVGICHTQCSRVVDVLPLTQYTNSLDVVPFDEGSLSHAVDMAIVYQGPYPSFSRPSQEECSEVCYRLSQLHGPLEEFAKHKVARMSENLMDYHEEEVFKAVKDVQHDPSFAEVQEALPSSCPREWHTVLDSLVGTMLSQNTTDMNSCRAFASLKARFPTWEAVYGADPKAVADAIRCGGLAEIKTSRILNILKVLDRERGKLCLEYVRNLSVDEIKLELSRFKGVGPKTIACVLMFHLQQNDFPVDTHVFHITKMLGWVPAKADREKAYLHLNHRIPNHLKFDLNCLLVTHGKRCPRCAKGGRTQRPGDGPCPLINLNRSLSM